MSPEGPILDNAFKLIDRNIQFSKSNEGNVFAQSMSSMIPFLEQKIGDNFIDNYY